MLNCSDHGSNVLSCRDVTRGPQGRSWIKTPFIYQIPLFKCQIAIDETLNAAKAALTLTKGALILGNTSYGTIWQAPRYAVSSSPNPLHLNHALWACAAILSRSLLLAAIPAGLHSTLLDIKTYWLCSSFPVTIGVFGIGTGKVSRVGGRRHVSHEI